MKMDINVDNQWAELDFKNIDDLELEKENNRLGKNAKQRDKNG